MSNRTNQIVDSVTAGVSSYREARGPIEALKSALEESDKALAEALINGGVALGARRDQIEALLEQVGLTDPAPVVVPEPEEAAEQATFPGTGGKKGERITALEASVADLTGKVDRLVSLAERHLGTRV